MGTCVGNQNKNGSFKNNSHSKEPSDTDQYANRQLPKLHFHGSLANFKIKNCTFPHLSMRVEIKDVETFLLKQKKVRNNQTAKWSFDQKFRFSMTEYELRKSFVKIYFQTQDQKVVGELCVNLFLISTGPYHQDYAVKIKKSQNFRVSFDIRISQIIEVNIDSIEAEVRLANKHPGEKFNFSIKTIIGYNTPLNVSSSSYAVQVMIDEREENQIENQSQTWEKKKSKKNLGTIKLIKANHQLIWNKTNDLQMPSVYMKILVSQLHHSYFQILIWKINDKSPSITEQNQIPELYGQCYIALHKLFDNDPDQVVMDGKLMEQRMIDGSQKIWHHGRALGTGSFKFNVQNQKYLKQMQVMVRTQEGICKYSPVFSNNSNKKSTCKQIESIIKIGEQIELNVEQLDKIQNSNSNPNLQIRKLKINIEKLLQNLVVLLQKSDKESKIFYYYSSELELYRAQETFIALGFKIISYLEEEDALINELCWQILIALIRRGQFLLVHIGFDGQEQEKIKNKQINKTLQNRLEIAVTYFQLLQKLLQIALNSLNIKGADYERCFAEMFCAYSYFRIPNFRNTILNLIVHANDPEITEWRGIQFGLQDDINFGELQKEVDAFIVLCDWDHYYHKCLENEERYQTVLVEIQELLNRQEWKSRLSKRGIAFFYFVKYWVEYIESIVVKTKDIQWKYFPGYNKLIKSLLVEMKLRPIIEYPDALKIACFKLLSNQKLLNPIFLIILNKKANMHEPLTVIKSIEFLNQILNVLCNDGKKIPPTFNYLNLYQSIKIICQSDFSFAISKSLIFLYTHFKLFNIQFRRNISMLLLGKLFFPLFLHWSNNVRHVFYNFVVMRVYRDTLEIGNASDYSSFQEEMNETIRSRFEQLIRILTNAENLKKEETRQNFIHSYEKDLYKKLKKKLKDKKIKNTQKMGSSDYSEKQDEKGSLMSIPESQKIDRSVLLGQKYSTTILSKNKEAERSHSQLIKNFKIVTQRKKEPEVRRLRTDRQYTFNHQIYDATTGKKEMKILNLGINFNQEDFEITEVIEPQFVEYILPAIKQFRQIKQELDKHLADKDWEIPIIQFQMPIDSKEIQPDQIDDW